MDNISHLREEIIDFFKDNGDRFEENLLSQAVNVSGKITEILEKGNIDLLKNARKLIFYIINKNDKDLIAFAEEEGIAWAGHSLTLSLKLEWVQAIRRTLWKIVGKIDEEKNLTDGKKDLYELEEFINEQIDQFLNSFFLSYSKYKDQKLHKQREIVEHLSVPIIPVSETVSVLPLIGTIDSFRIEIIEEKVLNEIANTRIQNLVVDLSGVAMMDRDVIDCFQKILSGVAMMGCKAILTGLRPELVRKMIHGGILFEKDSETRGTLKDTLKIYL
ncbi:STAS domain-containing protein [Cytobacillus firmus]|uniref:STAS domain-containing protein n=1 Tax=Cytobacillus firmus TaxID=1399 RepID=UPI001C961460|nr:STAS domain-containing protein [Cytobacillus firmus]MBY6054022.1 STAS domain-containing protein [Cytobacillus firmus]WHY59868.1 STAS domain-containing protein [Cytobacillus firmus]